MIIALGIHLTGLVRFRALEFEHRLQIRKKPLHVLGIFLVGMAFGAGWSPCIGPLLGSILIVAGNQETVTSGIGLLAVYAAAWRSLFCCCRFLSIPFWLYQKGLLVDKVHQRHRRILLLIMGLLLVTNRLNLISA